MDTENQATSPEDTENQPASPEDMGDKSTSPENMGDQSTSPEAIGNTSAITIPGDMDRSSSSEAGEIHDQDLDPETPPEPEPTPPPPPKTPPKKSKKRRSSETKTPPAKRATVKPSPGMSGDDARLLVLKDEGKTWKEITNIFKNEGRATVGPGTLAKRYSRLSAKLIVWDEKESEILLLAIAEVEKKKWENVSLKLIELGGGEIRKFSAAACEKRAKQNSAASQAAAGEGL